MQDQDIIGLWQSQNVKIEQSLVINNRLLQDLTDQKVHSSMRSFKWGKAIGIISFIVYLVILGSILFYAAMLYHHLGSRLNYFIISIAAIFLINIKGLSDYIRHLSIADRIDYDGSVAEIQEKLSDLRLSISQHVRTMFLQLPFFSTFYLSDSRFPHSAGWGYIILQIALTGSFTYISWWLYTDRKYATIDKKWFRALIAGSGGRSIQKALDFYNEVREFRQEI